MTARYRSLDDALAELERTDPAVAAASKRLDETVAHILAGHPHQPWCASLQGADTDWPCDCRGNDNGAR